MDAHDIKHIVFDLDDTLLATTDWQIGDKKSHIEPFAGVHDMLRDLTVPYSILTVGDLEAQNRKITDAKIQVVSIMCCDSGVEKLESLSEIIKKMSLNPAQVLVVGDKIQQEIRYGNQLGCRTVRTTFGGKHDSIKPNIDNENAHFNVSSIEDLNWLLSRLISLKFKS